MLKEWIAFLARSDWLLKLGILRKSYLLTGIDKFKIIIFELYYLTVLVYTKTITHLDAVGRGGYSPSREAVR